MTNAKALVALLVVLALVFVACGGEDESDEGTIQIGLVTDLTGRFVSFGRDIETASELAVANVNESGGINGAELQLVVIDSAGTPEQAVIGFRSLADDGAVAVSGPVSSGEAEVLFVQAAELGLPTITGTANKEGITELGEGWAFRNTATNTDLYLVAMEAWAAKYGVRSAVLVYDEQEPVTAAAAKNAIPNVAEIMDVELVETITFTRGTTDFATTVRRIKEEADADGLIIMSAPAEAGLLATELARQEEDRPILGHPAQAGDSFFTQGGAAINDWVLPSIFDPTVADEATQAFVVAMAEADDDPPTVPEAANYYDNILLLAQVMSDAGIDGTSDATEIRIAIRDGLPAISGFRGVAGEITFMPNGDAIKTVYVNVVIDGKPIPLDER